MGASTAYPTWFARSAVTALAVVFLIGFAGPSVAQSQSKFDKQWKTLVGAAKKEGSLSVASGGEPSRQYRPLLKAFTKKFGVRVDMSTGGANKTTSRVLAERREGLRTVDVALISIRINNLRLVPAKALVPFEPLLIKPDVIDKSNWYEAKHWYGDKYLTYTFIYTASIEEAYNGWYNTKKISESDIKTIKTPWDFFDPRWRGKLEGQAMEDPSGIRQMIDSWSDPDRGPKWVKKYLTDSGVTFASDRRILRDWLLGGRYPIWPVTAEGTAQELRTFVKHGFPIREFSLPKKSPIIRAEGSGCCISVFEGAPHPHAAKLFVNWFLSKEGQTILQATIPNMDRSSLRNDVPPGQLIEDQRRKPGKVYAFPDADPKSGARYAKAQKAIMKIWESRQR